jgi:hypothetical protein
LTAFDALRFSVSGAGPTDVVPARRGGSCRESSGVGSVERGASRRDTDGRRPLPLEAVLRALSSLADPFPALLFRFFFFFFFFSLAGFPALLGPGAAPGTAGAPAPTGAGVARAGSVAGAATVCPTSALAISVTTAAGSQFIIRIRSLGKLAAISARAGESRLTAPLPQRG